jgi:hypothetical protein
MAATPAANPDGVAQQRRGPAAIRATAVGLVATVVRWAGLVIALILVIHVLLTVGHANPDNGITVFFGDTAEPVALAFRNLFTPENPELRVLVNYGLAALFWLIVSGIVARLIRRLA